MTKRFVGILASVFMFAAMLLPTINPQKAETLPPPRCEFAKINCRAQANAVYNSCIADGQFTIICYIVYNDWLAACMTNQDC